MWRWCFDLPQDVWPLFLRHQRMEADANAFWLIIRASYTDVWYHRLAYCRRDWARKTSVARKGTSGDSVR
jgi:hypothetical protein